MARDRSSGGNEGDGQDDLDALDAFAGLEDLAELGREFEALDALAEAGFDLDEPGMLEVGGGALDDVGDRDAGERADDAEVEQLCHEALELVEAGELDDANDLATHALRLDDEHPFPYFVLALVAEQLDDLDAAADLTSLALRGAGTNADAIGLRAHVLVRRGELDEADELLRFGIVHNPDEAQLHEGLARVQLARGRHVDALASAEACLRLEPGNPGASSVRTASLDASGDRGALLASMRQSVQLHPEDPYALLELASLEVEHGNIDRARLLLMRAHRLAPRDAEVGDVRALVEHAHDHRLLRAVPTVVRWVREFPGGLPGFLLGLLVAALPLHALAVSQPRYLPAVAVVLGAWTLVAAYAWIGPALLTRRLDRRAALVAGQRVRAEIDEHREPMPGLARIADATSFLLGSGCRAEAAALLDAAGARAAVGTPVPGPRGERPDPVLAAELRAAGRSLRRPAVRIGAAVRIVPGDQRILVAAGTALALTSPALADATALTAGQWQLVAIACLALAWLLGATTARTLRRVEQRLSGIAELVIDASAHAAAGEGDVPGRRRGGDDDDDVDPGQMRLAG